MIRYNECWSDLEHMFNDIIGGGSNGSFRGSPGPDSDIYGNFVSHCWDDGLEVEGGSRNVRVWDNYITQCMMMIGNAAIPSGRSTSGATCAARSQSQPDAGGGNFLKMGFADGEQWMTGHMYIFHNTIFRSDEWLPTGGARRQPHRQAHRLPQQHPPRPLAAEPQPQQQQGRTSTTITTTTSSTAGSCDGQEAHGVRGEPIYAAGAGLDPATKTGQLPAGPGQSRRRCRAR